MAKEERQKDGRRKEDGRILCQSLIKKRRAWHGHRSVARCLALVRCPRQAVPCHLLVCMALLNTVTEDRGPCPASPRATLRFLVQTLLALLRLILPFPSSLFFYLLFSFLFLLFSHSFFFLFFVLLLSSIRICRFLSSLLFHRFNNTSLLWFLDIVHVLLLFPSLIFEFQKDDT